MPLLCLCNLKVAFFSPLFFFLFLFRVGLWRVFFGWVLFFLFKAQGLFKNFVGKSIL